MVEQHRTTAPPTTSTTQSSAPTTTTQTTLLSSAFDGPDRLVTTAYAYYNHNDCAPRDPDWVVTSGSWFIHNGAGYSGQPSRISGSSPCQVNYQYNGSYQLRMNTVKNDFTNTDIQFDYMLVSHGGLGGSTNSWDGVHIWTRHPSQYTLYAVSIGRWDGTFVVKKKLSTQISSCPSPANDGCYLDISAPVVRKDLTTANVWRHVEIKTDTQTDGSVQITAYINGSQIMQATDHQTGGPVIPEGAVGIRADNTEFYLKNFQVDAL